MARSSRSTGNVDSLMVKWLYHVPRAEELEGVPIVCAHWQRDLGNQDADGARYQGGAPLVVNNKVIVGLYGTSGLVDAYDAETGKPLWRWTALPKPGEAGSETWAGGDAWKFGGGPTWLAGSYDLELNLIYWGTRQGRSGFYRRRAH